MTFKYHGILAKKPRPKNPYPGDLPADEAACDAWQERQRAEGAKLLRALFDAHDVELYDWRKLSLRLALAHVPAFTPRGHDGPKKKWDARTLAELWLDVSEYRWTQGRAGDSTRITQACRALAGRSPWAQRLRRGVKNPTEALRAHYNHADTRVVASILRERMLKEAMGLGLLAPAKSPPPKIARRKKSR
jgi:hypothetical protein